MQFSDFEDIKVFGLTPGELDALLEILGNEWERLDLARSGKVPPHDEPLLERQLKVESLMDLFNEKHKVGITPPAMLSEDGKHKAFVLLGEAITNFLAVAGAITGMDIVKVILTAMAENHEGAGERWEDIVQEMIDEVIENGLVIGASQYVHDYLNQ